MKAKIVFLFRSQYGDYLAGETGVVDGYVSGGDGTPCAIVICDRNSQFVLAPLTHLKKMYWINENNPNKNNPNGY